MDPLDKTIDSELSNILHDLSNLSRAVASREKSVGNVKQLYLKQEGSETYELSINNQTFYFTHQDFQNLMDQMQEVGIFSRLSDVA